MLSDQDVQKLTESQRQIFPTKEDLGKLSELVLHTRQEMDVKFEALHQSFSELQTSVDAYARKADAYFQEMVALSHRVNRHEKWLQQIADKLGIKLDY